MGGGLWRSRRPVDSRAAFFETATLSLDYCLQMEFFALEVIICVSIKGEMDFSNAYNTEQSNNNY